MEVYYTKGFQWNADLFAHQIDCAPIAEKLAGKYGRLTGTINGTIAIMGKGTTINKCNGILSLDRPGELRIQSADRLLNDLRPTRARSSALPPRSRCRRSPTIPTAPASSG